MKNKQSATILVIDDEPSIRDSFSVHLADANHRVLTAENGRVGLRVFEAEQPDLVLIDLRMPEMDGLEVISCLQEQSPETPLLVISGTGRLRDAIEAIRAGAWDYLTKPVEDMSVLNHAVEKALERSRLLRENRDHQEYLEVKITERTEALDQANTRLKNHNGRLRLVIETIQLLASCTSSAQLSQTLFAGLERCLAIDDGCLYLANDLDLRLLHALSADLWPDILPRPLPEDSLLSLVFKEEKSLLMTDITRNQEVSADIRKIYPTGSILIFPLPGPENRVSGILILHKKELPPFTKQDRGIGDLLVFCCAETIRAVRAIEEKDHLITELRTAAKQIKTLRGIMPICATCKKIRDDKGYWQQVDIYIQNNSEAELSHGICPECLRRLYPEYAEDILKGTPDGGNYPESE